MLDKFWKGWYDNGILNGYKRGDTMNVDKLTKVMKKNRDNQKELANAVGLSTQRLSEKIHNRRNASFTQPEIVAIKKRYNLSKEEVMAIFFENDVS